MEWEPEYYEMEFVKCLDKNKNVVSYRDGGPNEGGLGATLVYFE